MSFPSYFSFDGNKVSFDKLEKFNWSSSIKIRQHNSILTLYGNTSTKYKLPIQLGPQSIPVCKSNLQKCIRRQNSDKSIKTALAMYSYDPNEVLRRLPIIMIEDCLICPDLLIKLVWWMCAVSKGYEMSKEEIESMLGIVNTMCDSPVYDVCVLEDDIKVDYESLSSKEQDFLYALELRKIYGGMMCDKKMINYHIMLWSERFESKNDICKKAYNQDEYVIELESVDSITNEDILLESIDYHPYPFIISKLKGKINSDQVKSAIWNCQSRINYRTPIDNNFTIATKEMSNNYKAIKEQLTNLSLWIRNRLNLHE